MDNLNSSNLPPAHGVLAGNIGKPLHLKGIEAMDRIVLDSGEEGEEVRVSTQIAATSDEPIFHKLVEQIEQVILRCAQKNEIALNLKRYQTILLIYKPGGCADLWLDAAAVVIQCILKQPQRAGAILLEDDIADITGMTFPLVDIGPRDRVACVFREGWAFGVAADLCSTGERDQGWLTRNLGTLYRTLKYRHIYNVVNSPATFESVCSRGWFPFVEIVSREFRDLAEASAEGFDLSQVETKILAAFTPERLRHMFKRWCAKPHFVGKSDLLREALDAFEAGRAASAIKIILTEIEGILNEAYKSTHGGTGAKIQTLLTFAQESAERRTGGPNTLLFPSAFGKYLRQHPFANFDPTVQTGTAASRHAVGHGAAAQETYTMTRALQAILTLDQLAFYT